MTCNQTVRSLKRIQLSNSEQALIRPAVAVLQLGTGMYFGEILKEYMLPMMMMSLSYIAFVTVNAWKKNPNKES